MQCPQCRTENPNQAKFCLECGTKLALTCPQCGVELPAQAKFCFECGARIGAPPPPPEPEPPPSGLSLAERMAQRLERLVPKEFAERLLAARGKMQGERRVLTILFSDIKGSTAMAEDLDPEDVMEIMDGVFDYLIEPIYRHEGIVARLMGDAILAFFGAPISHENDPERACRAALEIVSGVEEYAARLEAERGIHGFNVRVGINSGLVVVGEVGSDLRMEYTAMGDAINLAARMEQNAPVGGILISYDTYRLVRGLFDVQALDPITVKGKREPVRVYLVERARPRAFHMNTRGVAGVETRMIGREAELKRLQDALLLAIEDHERQMVTVVGEAGLGKSRLLYEFEAWLDRQPERLRFFKGRASQEMQTQPYALLRDLFANAFRIQDSDPPNVMRQKVEQGILSCGLTPPTVLSEIAKSHFIGQLLGFDFGASPHLQEVLDDPKQLHDRALIYLNEFFRTASTRLPTAIFLEDIHWADDSSLDAVNQLALALPELPLFIACMGRPTLFERRPHWGEGQTFHTLVELHPLSKRDSRHLVQEILQRLENVPERLRELVVGNAEGNPLYVEELIKMLIEDGVVVRTDDASPWRVQPERLTELGVPPTLTAVLQARLDSLPLDERTILQQASVVGRQFWDDAVEQINRSTDGELNEKQIETLLSTLRDREMVLRRETSTLTEAQEYTFKHAVLQEVTYENVLRRVRRTYHRVIAGWLIERSGERAGEFTGLIAEHLELGGETEQAVAYLTRAGRQAAAQFANAEAVDYFSRALRMLDRAKPDADQARQERYHLLLGREGVYGLLGQREQQAADLAGLSALVDETEGASQRAVMAHCWALYHEAISDFPAALAAAEETVRWAEQAGDSERMVGGLIAVGRALMRQGRFQEARQRLEEALDLARRHGHRSGEAGSRHYLGTVLYYLGDYEGALADLETARSIRHELGDRRGEAVSLNNLSGVYHGLGDLSMAQECTRQTLDIYEAIGDRTGESQALTNLGVSYQAVGKLDDARQYLEHALALHQLIEDRRGEALVAGNLGLLLHDMGDNEAARRYCEQALMIRRAVGDRSGEGCSLTYLALALEGLGDWAGAARAYRQAFDLRRELGQAARAIDDLAGLIRVALQHDDLKEALVHADEILAWIEAQGVASIEYPLRAYLACADALTAAGQRARAGQVLAVANALLHERAERISDESTRQSFLKNIPLHQQLRERLVR